MDIPWTIATAVISAASALLGVHLSNRAQEKRLKIQFENEALAKSIELKKSKLEEMFILFQKWEMDISCLYLRLIPAFKGEYSAIEARKTSSENALQEKGDYQRFQAILNLYFPEHNDAFQQVMTRRAQVLKFCNGAVDARPENLPQFYKAQEAFESEAASFRGILADTINEL